MNPWDCTLRHCMYDVRMISWSLYCDKTSCSFNKCKLLQQLSDLFCSCCCHLSFHLLLSNCLQTVFTLTTGINWKSSCCKKIFFISNWKSFFKNKYNFSHWPCMHIFPFILMPSDVLRSYEARVRILEEEVKSMEGDKLKSDIEINTVYKEVSKLLWMEHGKSTKKWCNNYTVFYTMHRKDGSQHCDIRCTLYQGKLMHHVY